MPEPLLTDFIEVVSGIYLEGLAVDLGNDAVWYSDVISGGVHSVQSGVQSEECVTLNPERMWTGGVMVNQDGKVLSTGQGGIMWNDPATGESGWLLHEIDGEVINGINEMAPDGEGGIFFGTNDIEMVIEGGKPRPTKLYHLSKDQALTMLAEDFGFTNGLMYDDERKRLYINDTFYGTWAFDVTDDLRVTNRQVLIEKEDADGMVLDAQGNVWITGFRSGHFVRINPQGEVIESAQTPAGAITQLRFGGADLQDLYFNAVPADGGDSLKDGEIPTEKNSIMYKARSAVAGKKLAPLCFELA